MAKKKSGRKPSAAFMKPMTPSAQLAAVVGANPERADVAKLPAQLRGVLDEIRGARLLRSINRQPDRPHAPLNVIGEEVPALIRCAERSAAIDVPARDRLARRMVVLENRIDQRLERRRPARPRL